MLMSYSWLMESCHRESDVCSLSSRQWINKDESSGRSCVAQQSAVDQ